MDTLIISHIKYDMISIDTRVYKRRRCIPMSKIYLAEGIVEENE